MLPEYPGSGGLQGSPDEFMFEGRISRDQLAKGARKRPIFGYEGLFRPSEANKAFGVGDVSQTTTAKTVPVNRFLGFNLDDLVGKIGLNSRRGLEALQNIPGYKGITDVIADPTLARAIGSNKALTAAKVLGGAARFMPLVQAPLGALATAGHARDIAEANERGDTLQALSSTLKAGLSSASMAPIVGIAPYLAELGLEGAEEIRNRFFPFDAGEEAVGAEQSSQPVNLGQEHTETLRSFLPPITFPEGTVAPYLGPLGDPPNREDWFQDDPDAFTVTDRSEASLYPIGFTTGSRNPATVPDLSAIGINPTPDYTWQEILGVQPDLGGRPAFNVDEFGNRASLARFREPEVDTDDFIRENLIEAVAPAPTVTRSQPGPGGPARDRSPEPERDRTPDPKPKPKPRKKPPRKKKKKKKKKKELVPVVSQNEIFEARHQALMDALTQGYSRAGRAVEPPSHMLYDI
jgi:hypothetical protein